MSVPTKPFSRLVNGIAARVGLDPTDLSAAKLAQLLEFANSAAKMAWEFYLWPDAQTLHSEPVIAHPSATGARYIPKTTDIRRIALLSSVWDADPRVNPCASPLRPWVRPEGYYFDAAAPATVWIEYRPMPPEYSVTPHSTAATWQTGDLVWDKTGSGHVYKALQSVPTSTAITNTAYWQPVPVLDCLIEPIKAGAIGAWHASDGQHGTARVKLEYMQDLLEHEILQITNQAGA